MRDRPERVAVTGGAGFIGSHLVDTLLDAGAREVVVLDNLSRGRPANLERHAADSRLRFIEADVRDSLAVRRALKGAEVVYHLAAQATVMGAALDADYTFSTNVVGTYNVLHSAAEQGIRRVVFASSREVYGEPLSLPVDEAHPLLSINMYGASKVAGEALCRAFARESSIETTVLRLANVYGDRDFGRVIPHWVSEARSGRDIIVYGGKQVIDFIWVGDVVRAMTTAAAIGAVLPPINVASGTGTKILDLARRIASLADSRGEIQIVPRRAIEVTRFIGNTERMTQFLGLSPTVDSLSHLAGMIRTFAGAVA